MHTRADAPAQFCDFCDYDLAGLPPDSRCPECGEKPTFSPGTPWQRRKNIKMLTITMFMMCFRPADAFRRMRISPTPSAPRSLAIAGALLFAPMPAIGALVGEAPITLVAVTVAVAVIWFACAGFGLGCINWAFIKFAIADPTPNCTPVFWTVSGHAMLVWPPVCMAATLVIALSLGGPGYYVAYVLLSFLTLIAAAAAYVRVLLIGLDEMSMRARRGTA